MIFQIMAMTLVVVAVISCLRQTLRRRMSTDLCIVVCAFWTLVAVVTLRPDSTTVLAHLVGIGRGVDLMIYVSILLLFGIAMRQILQAREQRRSITLLTRLCALTARTLRDHESRLPGADPSSPAGASHEHDR